MIVRRPEMRLKLASILAKLMNLPAPVAVSEAPHRRRGGAAGTGSGT